MVVPILTFQARWFFNNLGKAGGNIPLDLRMEHLNKLLKIALKQLGSNVSEKGAQRIAKSLQAIEEIIVNVDKDCNRKYKYYRTKFVAWYV